MIAKTPRIRSNARSPQRSNRRDTITLSGIKASSGVAMPSVSLSSERLSMRPSNNKIKRLAIE